MVNTSRVLRHGALLDLEKNSTIWYVVLDELDELDVHTKQKGLFADGPGHCAQSKK